MLFNFIPDKDNLPELPDILQKESDKHYERLKQKLSQEQLSLFEAQSDFRWVLGISDFIANTIFMYPNECARLLSLGALDDPKAVFDSLKEEISSKITPSLSDFEFKHRLRVIRRTMMVPVAWRDLTGRATDIEESFTLLSDLAELIVLKTLSAVRQSFAKMFGDALDDGKSMPLLTYGMGKLGGRELNFSSDLDLIFCYPHEGETSGGIRSITIREFFTRIVQRTANLLSDKTVDSFCYRIDLRLRPFGDAGALVNSFDALANYYETQGRTWERYALVKARLLGSPRDWGGYADELNEMLKPFVFRRYLDYGAIMSLRKLKHMIEAEVRRRRLVDNFKLGRGGIREIEFIAQVFELMRGGRIPELQERNLRRTLVHLEELEILPHEVCELLDTCYICLRRLENCIQEFADQQTQTLPDGEKDRSKVVLVMHKNSWQEFYNDLEKVMVAVHNEFDKVVSSDEDEDEGILEGAELWESDFDASVLSEMLSLYVADEQERKSLAESIIILRSTLAGMPVGPVGRETLLRLMPKVITQVANASHPDELFRKIGSLIEKIALRTTYLQLLDTNKSTLQRLITLLQENAFAADLISAHPILLDELIVPQYLETPPKPEEFLQMLQERLLRIDADDLEEQMEELRLFKKIMVLRIAMSDKSEHLPLMKISDSLTWLAEAIVREMLNMSWDQMQKKYGAPDGASIDDPGIAVIAYGKLGGIELGYKSDLDMVFISDGSDGMTNGENSVPDVMFYQRLVQRLLHLSTTRTVGGILYDLDMRLRPDGDSGVLISDVKSFYDYQKTRAWTWEHQALVRARPIAGSKKVIDRFCEIREEVLRTPRDGEKLRLDVIEMREKMRKHLDRGNESLFDLKESAGGIVDIEFLAQYLLLREAPQHPDMVLWSDNVRILDECSRLGILPSEQCELLKKAYLQLRGLYHRYSLADKPRIIPKAELPSECSVVSQIWQDVLKTGVTR